MKRKAKETSEFELNKEGRKEVDPSIITSEETEKLFELIKADNVEGVRGIIDNIDFDFNIANAKGYLPIHIAAKNGSVGVLRYLIEKQGLEVLTLKVPYLFYSTPLFIAVSKGHAEIVKVLLEVGVKQEAHHFGAMDTPLWVAAKHGHIDVVRVLLEYGANKEIQTQVQNNSILANPLVIAATSGHTGVVKLLLENGAELIKDLSQMTLKQVISDLIDITKATRDICKFIDEISKGLKDPGENHDFALRIFKQALVEKGLPCNSYEEFKYKITKLYTGKISDVLLGALIKEVDEYEKCAIEEIKTIEGVLLSHFHDISPMPYSKTLEEQEKDGGFDPSKATPEALIEHKKYTEFYNNPNNAKYKIPGTKLMELMKATCTTHLIALTDLILRAVVMADDDSIQGGKTNILKPVNEGVLLLNQKIILPRSMKQALQKVMEEYNKYKDSPLMKTLITLDNEIEMQKEEISDLKEVQKVQVQKIAKLESFIYKHFGLDLAPDISNNNSYAGIDDAQMDISGDYHDSTGYHGEFSS